MPTILAALALCAASVVHDGDTIRCGAERVRIANIDAPELPGSPRCDLPRPRWAWCDYALGARSRDALAQLVAGRRVTIARRGRDRYGRTLALVRVEGIDAGEWLIARGLARPWR